MGPEQQNAAKSLDKALSILSKFAYGHGEWGIRELARELDMSKSTVFRIVQTLENNGFLKKNPVTYRYSIGIELFSLSSAIAHQFDLLDTALPVMHEIVHKCDETVFLHLYKKSDHVVPVYKVECSHRVRYNLELGMMYDIYLTAIGKAVLAHLDEDGINRVLSKKLKRYTEKTITDPTLIREELARIRAQGFAFSYGEQFPDVASVASPILERDGSVLGGISLAIPDPRYDPNKYDLYTSLIRRGAMDISRAISNGPHRLATIV